MQLYIPLKPRSWHIARPVYRPNSTECDVVIFGGNVHVEGHQEDSRVYTADLQILSSGMRSLCSELYRRNSIYGIFCLVELLLL